MRSGRIYIVTMLLRLEFCCIVFLIFKQSLFFIMYVWASHERLRKKKMTSDPLELEIYDVPLVPESNPGPLLKQQELVNTKLCL